MDLSLGRIVRGFVPEFPLGTNDLLEKPNQVRLATAIGP